MPRKAATADARIAQLAERQHGVVSIAQLGQLGVGEEALRGRIAAGRLHPLHRGVYAVGHSAPSQLRRWMAAVLAVGRRAATERSLDSESPARESVLEYWGAALSHRSAACLWSLLPVDDGPVDVIVRGLGGKTKRSGIRIHRSRTLIPSQVILRHGIPVTTPARTISDLQLATRLGRPGGVSQRELRKAMRQANVFGFPVDKETAKDRTRGDLESDFLQLCCRNGLPRPEVNVRIGRHLVDFLWREQRLAVETDHYLHHRGRTAFQDDRARDLDLRSRGYEVLRLSEKQIDDEADRVGEALKAMLRA